MIGGICTSPNWVVENGVYVGMTIVRITDLEILEKRYPLALY
jgi:N-methylhydantoinase B/oxoprolinase/acetone carboxylase alpha subunit